MVVYIAAPANAYTGGPTALFQVCNALRKRDINAIMAFYGEYHDNPMHPNYLKYQCPWVRMNSINDNYMHAVIVPETAIDRVIQFTKVTKIIYWLAVDNFILSMLPPKILNFIAYIIREYIFDPYILYTIITGYEKAYYNSYLSRYVNALIKREKAIIPRADLHLVQSKYARDFLKRHGIKDNTILQVHEPIEEEFLSKAKNINHEKKVNAIAWNTRKAYPIAFKLVHILRRHGFSVYDLANVGKQNMINLLSKTKLFLDIGIHPGRDRPIREAIALDNIAIVNNHGGYYYFEDCMIPSEFKWDCYFDCKTDIKGYASIIDNYLENYDYYIKKFQNFKQYILEEPSIFLGDMEYLARTLIRWGVN